MNNENVEVQLASIRMDVTEKLKLLLIESLPQEDPLIGSIRADPSGILSSDTAEAVRHTLGAQRTAVISAELISWCADEYDYLDYAEYERKCAITRAEHLTTVLNARL